MIYSEYNAKGKFIDSDYLYLIINSSYSSYYYSYINLRKIFKIKATNMESEDINFVKDYDGYFYIIPKKTDIYNYDSLFIQVFTENSYSLEFKLYKDLEIFLTFSLSSYKIYDISKINTENQLMLYNEHNKKFSLY